MKKIFILIFLLLFMFSGIALADEAKTLYSIKIHKLSHVLELYKNGSERPYRVFGCAVGKNPGDKQWDGDCTTPVSWGNVMKSLPGAKPGTPCTEIPFVVDKINDASDWTHDFKDGRGEIKGAYGPWFISLNTGWDGIGIHGTHDYASIGSNASEGCIRLRNDNVQELKELLSSVNGGIGIQVIILED